RRFGRRSFTPFCACRYFASGSSPCLAASFRSSPTALLLAHERISFLRGEPGSLSARWVLSIRCCFGQASTRLSRTVGLLLSTQRRRLSHALGQILQIFTQALLHFLARHDGVDEPVVQQKLRRLKARR